jgi:hypothetical protein
LHPLGLGLAPVSTDTVRCGPYQLSRRGCPSASC